MTAYWCHKNHVDRPTYGKWFELYMLLIILVIPVLVMSVTYTWIANIIWHVATRRADMRSGRSVELSTSLVFSQTFNEIELFYKTDLISLLVSHNAANYIYLSETYKSFINISGLTLIHVLQLYLRHR